MPMEPSDSDPSASRPADRPDPAGARPPPIQRERSGGSWRRGRHDVVVAPVSRSDLGKGPQELLEHRASRTNWRVLVVSSLVILAVSLWAIAVPDTARVAMKAAVDWIALNLGWYYVVTVTLVIGFVLWVALSKEGDVRLGPDHSRPQYGLGTWVAMLFAAGVGIDMLFYSVTGPVVQYLYPPAGDGASAEALQDAVVWPMFHYGIAGWSLYALLSMALRYFAYPWGMPLSIRPALYPLLGKRVRGPLGDGISIIALVGTVFGVATSMGIGAVLLTIAATTFDRGIRWTSELNLWSAVSRGKPRAGLVRAAVDVPRGHVPDWPGHAVGAAVLPHQRHLRGDGDVELPASIPDPRQDGPKWLRVFGAVLTAVLTVAM